MKTKTQNPSLSLVGTRKRLEEALLGFWVFSRVQMIEVGVRESRMRLAAVAVGGRSHAKTSSRDDDRLNCPIKISHLQTCRLWNVLIPQHTRERTIARRFILYPTSF